MKKHLIAAAVAAAVAVPAVAQVTVSGVLDVSGIQNFKTTTETSPTASSSVKASNTAAQSGWSTSELRFSGTEDLGGGLKASFAIATGLGHPAANSFDRDRFVQLAGGFGTVRLGGFVPAAPQGFHGYTQTNLGSSGSLYSVSQENRSGSQGRPSNFGGNDGATTVSSTTQSHFERNNNNIQYTSPTINGFTVNVNARQTKDDASATLGSADTRQQGLHVQYVAGPLSIGAATNDIKNNVEGVAAANGTSNKRDLDWVGGQYNFGVATVSFVNIKRSGSNTDAAGAATTVDDLSINAVGASVPFGALTLRFGAYEGKNARAVGATDDLKLSGHQASVTYTLSKRTLAYAVIGETKSTRSGSNITTGARKVNSSMLGLSHSF